MTNISREIVKNMPKAIVEINALGYCLEQCIMSGINITVNGNSHDERIADDQLLATALLECYEAYGIDDVMLEDERILWYYDRDHLKRLIQAEE